MNKAARFRTRRLDPRLLRNLEQAFGHDLSGIECVEFDPTGQMDDVLACAVGNRVCLSSTLNRCSDRDQARVIAHEIVHVIQKRSSTGRRGSVAELELEAELGSHDAIVGRPFQVQFADAAAIPRFWGPAGHYFTCLFVMPGAGVAPRAAFTRAFFCQMPDEVTEFDATEAMKDAVFTGAQGLVRTEFGSPTAVIEAQARIQEDMQVSAGLHSLSGGSSLAEQGRRKLDLTKLFRSKDHLAVGLAMHAFGDSFAHVQLTDETLMYPTGIGHGEELFGHYARGRAGKAAGKIAIDYLDALIHPSDLGRMIRDGMLIGHETVDAGSEIDCPQESVRHAKVAAGMVLRGMLERRAAMMRLGGDDEDVPGFFRELQGNRNKPGQLTHVSEVPLKYLWRKD